MTKRYRRGEPQRWGKRKIYKTLSLDPDVVEASEQYAEELGRTLGKGPGQDVKVALSNVAEQAMEAYPPIAEKLESMRKEGDGERKDNSQSTTSSTDGAQRT